MQARHQIRFAAAQSKLLSELAGLGATARAVAVDTASEERLASAIRSTRVGGRVVAPASAALLDGVRELARDQSIWVGAREAAPSELVTLHVRRG